MTVFKVRVTEAQADRLKERILGAGLQVEFNEEQPGALVLILHNISQAHNLRDIVASEGISVFYDAD
jgi:hypothetical protein